jgi:hypothetical protein
MGQELGNVEFQGSLWIRFARSNVKKALKEIMSKGLY